MLRNKLHHRPVLYLVHEQIERNQPLRQAEQTMCTSLPYVGAKVSSQSNPHLHPRLNLKRKAAHADVLVARQGASDSAQRSGRCVADSYVVLFVACPSRRRNLFGLRIRTLAYASCALHVWTCLCPATERMDSRKLYVSTCITRQQLAARMRVRHQLLAALSRRMGP